MIRVLFSAPASDWNDYRDVLPQALSDAGIKAEVLHELSPKNPDKIDYIVFAPSSRLKDFSSFTGAKAVLNLWAGVESIVGNQTLTQPLARMVDPGLTEGMVEWCVAQVLRHHLGLDRDICRADAHWDPVIPPLARDRRVTILGMGVLGRSLGKALSALNFPVTGWSRRAKQIAGIRCLSGNAGLVEALNSADVLVLLLPLTAATENLLNNERLGLLPEKSVLINPGRGSLVDDQALLAALDCGRVAHATLDVFREEPLPSGHPFWSHSKVTVTPHVASATRPQSATRVIVENIRRGEASKPFLHLVDRDRGY